LTSFRSACAKKAFLNKGIRITIKDEREEPEKSHEFYYRGGIAEFVKHLNKNKSVLHDKPIYFERVSDVLAIEVAINTTTAMTRRSIHSPTTSTRSTAARIFLAFVQPSHERSMPMHNQSGLAKNFKTSLTGDDVREGLVAVSQ